MFQSVGKDLPEKLFAAVFVVFSVVVGPGLFLSLFYGNYFRAGNFASLVPFSAMIGLPINVAFYILYRLLFKMGGPNNGNILPEIKIVFCAITAIYCGFAFVLPCAVKLINPILSLLEGTLIFVSVHLVGLIAAVAYCLKR